MSDSNRSQNVQSFWRHADHQAGSGRVSNPEQPMEPMHLPLFPLRLALFPGMMLPLHIFEPRYRAMIHYCLENQSPFGVVMIREGQESGGPATPYEIGTAARITKVEKESDGRMNIMAVGTRRFRIEKLDHSHSYLSAEVSHYPILNGSTTQAMVMANRIRPKILRYVELLAKSTGTQLQLAQLPEDPTTLAMLIGIAIQVNPEEKQKILALAGIPEMLDWENFYLARELQLLQYTVDTQQQVLAMSSGPTGYIFPN
jgi:Lon protease-like protein